MKKLFITITSLLLFYTNIHASDIENKVLANLTDEARVCTVYYKIMNLSIEQMPNFKGKQKSLEMVFALQNKAEETYVNLSDKIQLSKKDFQKNVEKDFIKLTRVSGNDYQFANRFQQIYEKNCLDLLSNFESRYHYWKSKIIKNDDEKPYNWKLNKVYYCDINPPKNAPPPPNPILHYSFVVSFNEIDANDKYALQLYSMSPGKEQQTYDTYRNDEDLFYGIANDVVNGPGKILVIDKLENKAVNTFIDGNKINSTQYNCRYSD